MPISGVVVTCVPGCGAVVAETMSSRPGVEVHGVLADGQIVAVLEADSVQAEVDLVSGLHDIDGVVAVRLAYHNFEDVEQV
jgi:periplasmic nitrate reductase NapD